MNYAYSLSDYYDCGAVIEQKSFSFDAENQQWLEGAGPGRDIEKEIRQMPYGRDQRLFVPSRWTVELRSTGVVVVSLELYMAEIRHGVLHSIQEKEWLIECDLPNSKVQAWPIALLKPRNGGWVGTFSCTAGVTLPDMLGASYVEVPTVVTETAMAYMQKKAEEEFGFRPTYMGNIHGMEHMLAYCVRPLDINIHLLRHVIGNNYENIFPREQRDNYHPLCRFFQIEHPPKSLRKAYGEGAENMVAYLLFRQLGFRDINVIRRFFHRDKLFGYRLLDLSYQAEQSKMVPLGGDWGTPNFYWLERFCHWFLRYRKETQLANCLHPLAIQDVWEQHVIDILRMFTGANADHNDNVLHADTRRILLREGFTQNVHDLMMNELPGIVRQRPYRDFDMEPPAPPENKEIQYTDKERGYVDEMEGYQILLPKDTDEIRAYGRAFHNCVASYCNSVLEKRTLILAMKRGQKYIACLEVAQNRLVQALGPCNQRLTMEIGEVICHWADKKKIGYKLRQ